MIGLVIVTHGGLASEFKSALEHVVGVQKNIAVICIDSDDDMEQRRADIAQAAQETDNGEGVILLTDMFGGTPSNLAISLLDQGHIEVIAGVNLPMLIKLAGVRDKMSLEESVAAAQEAARKYISVASQVLNQKKE
ncbi:MAG: PTS sugar transporter subunit IIA [Alphaproteobacteria bacterium]|nr:PTS sugar transporter subunit IIA [Alphaproteobacteria bacterium]